MAGSNGQNKPALAPRGSQFFRSLLDSENLEQVIRDLPASALHIVCRRAGLSSAIELLEISSEEQIRLVLDLDLWAKDRFAEERVWEWLELPDSSQSLTILRKIVRSIDLKLIGFLIQKHVSCIIREDSTDQQPGPDYYTPDNGFTWLRVEMEDSHKAFLLNRLLAQLAAMGMELLYQLLSISSVATLTVLEEDGFQEKERRLAALGFPDADTAFHLTAALSLTDALASTNQAPSTIPVGEFHPNIPLLIYTQGPEPLREILNQALHEVAVQNELTLLFNAAIVRWSVDLGDQERTEGFLEFVMGSINIGLSIASNADPERPLQELFVHLGPSRLFRIGWGDISQLTRQARALQNSARDRELDPRLDALLDGLTGESFPTVPQFIIEGAKDEKLDQTPVALSSLATLERVKGLLAVGAS